MKYEIPTMLALILLMSGVMQLRVAGSFGGEDSSEQQWSRWSGYALLIGAAAAAAIHFFV